MVAARKTVFFFSLITNDAVDQKNIKIVIAAASLTISDDYMYGPHNHQTFEFGPRNVFTGFTRLQQSASFKLATLIDWLL